MNRVLTHPRDVLQQGVEDARLCVSASHRGKKHMPPNSRNGITAAEVNRSVSRLLTYVQHFHVVFS